MPAEDVDTREGLLEATKTCHDSTSPSYGREDAQSIVLDSHSLTSSIAELELIYGMEREIENVSTGTASDTLYNALLKRQPSPTQLELHQCLMPIGLTNRKFTLRDEFSRAASETFKVSRLSFTLLKYLGIGYRWMNKLGALTIYAMFLTPGFLQVGYSYLRDKRIQRSIVYGLKPRNRLDLYIPENLDSPKPVVAFVTGGAWIIGYKAWGSLMGLELVENDVIVACIDYRNFPQGTISDMVEDAMQGIAFICNNIAQFGGDPDRIYLAGQSAGAHIAACALIEQAIKEIRVGKGLKSSDGCGGENATLTWKASQIKGFFGISGGYNLENLVDHFHHRGLYRSLFLSIMEGQESLSWFSPELRVKSLSMNAGASLPPIYLFHGTADYSIPCEASESFTDVLLSIGAKVTKRFYEGKTHTDIFLQDPMRGGHDVLVEDILSVVHAGDQEALAKDASRKPRRRLVPEFLLQLSRNVSPF